MKLYGSYTSPFVRHCRVALAQEGLDFEFIEADHAMAAKKSPTAKVPFLADGNLTLTDSSSILKHLREQSGGRFLADLQEYETFAMANTLLDSAINVFLLENEGFDGEKIQYISRQKNRIASGLTTLDQRLASAQQQDIAGDGALRCACFLGWALFRKRITLDQQGNLRALLATAEQVPAFAATAPPA